MEKDEKKKSDHHGKLAKEASKAQVKICKICLKNIIQVMKRINFVLNMMC